MQLTTISHTAWLVMLCQLILKEMPRWSSLVPDDDVPFYRHCFDYCRTHSRLFRTLSLIPRTQHLKLIEAALAVGAPQHYILRKRAIADQVAKCIKNGVTQIVVVGGGFDALALRTARQNPAVTCFELDKPAMHTHKIYAARSCYGVLPVNFFGIGADLSEAPLFDVLSSHAKFDRNRPTLFIAEGLTMYLDGPSIEALLDDMHRLCDISPSLVFSAVERKRYPTSGLGGALRRMTLALCRERFDWSMPRERLPSFLAAHAFTPWYILNYADLQKPWRSPEELAVIEKQNGEYLVYAVANPKGRS